MTELLSQGLFDRVTELVIQREGVAYKIEGLRIEFRVQKFASPLVDNRGSFRVFNLRSTVRDLVNRRRLDLAEGPYTTVFLSAGYRPDGAALIFRGVIIDGANYRTGPDWISEFVAYTAAQQINAAMCDDKCTWLRTPPKVIADRLFSLLNFNNPTYSAEALNILIDAPQSTHAFTGRVDRALADLLARHQLHYTLEDDGPFVIRVGSALNPNDPVSAIPEVSPSTGLVGTPRITDSGVEIRSLLNARLKVFHRFNVSSESTDGSLVKLDRQFVAVKIEHFGSNRDTDYFTEASGQFFPRIQFDFQPPDAPAAFTSNPVQIGGT